jgi:hypothetical protein
MRKAGWIVQRAARVAYAFVMMNLCAVQGLLAVVLRRKVWR